MILIEAVGSMVDKPLPQRLFTGKILSKIAILLRSTHGASMAVCVG